MTTDGMIKFHKPFVIFNQAYFKTHYPTNDLAPLHYSIEMERECSAVSSSTNLFNKIQQAESLLLESFKRQSFKRQYDGFHYQSSCVDIDGLGWDVCFYITSLSDNNKTSYVVKAKFYNPLHRIGRFISCEDFADADPTRKPSQSQNNRIIKTNDVEVVVDCPVLR